MIYLIIGRKYKRGLPLLESTLFKIMSIIKIGISTIILIMIKIQKEPNDSLSLYFSTDILLNVKIPMEGLL